MQHPLVSILINNYNNGPWIEACVRSALEQTYPHVEVIVYDDGSTDESLEVLRRFGDRIRLIAPGKNFGAPSPNFNQAHAIWRAFQASRGQIICLLDGDDAFLPQKVARVVEAFAKTPEAVMVQHRFVAIDGTGQVVEPVRPRKLLLPQREGYTYAAFILKYHCLIHLFMQTSALSFRRDFLERHLPIPPDRYDKLWPDFRLSRRAAFEGQIVTLLEPLAAYRLHDRNWIHQLRGAFHSDMLAQAYAWVNEELLGGQGRLHYLAYRAWKWLSPVFWRFRLQKGVEG